MNIAWTCFYLLPVLLFPVLWVEQRRLSGSHSLRYLFSFLSELLPGVPQYSVVGFVDDVPIINYNSKTGRARPRARWMEKATDEDPQFWENIEKELQDVKKILQDGFKNLMEQKNQAPGLHVLQVIKGCELHEDGSGSSFQRFAFDGQNLTTATDPASDTQKQRECIENLKNFLQIGEESLLRRVTPQTMVSQRKSGNHTFLIGYAYGFYPRDIEVKWVRDGVEIPWESRELLPNPDGTYQVRTAVEVQEGDDVRTYEYHVNPSSLPVTGILTAEYGPHGRSAQGRLLLLVASLMTAVLGGAVVFLWKPLKSFFTSRCRAQRSNEAQPSGGGSEGMEMVPLQRDTHSDTAGPSTGSDVRSSTCKGSQDSVETTG